MIYLDNASTTPIKEEYIDTINFILSNSFGNPSNFYKIGNNAKDLIETSREKIAQALCCKPNEIFFTSSASEGNAWVCNMGSKVFCSPFEHHSILANSKSFIVDDSYVKSFIQVNGYTSGFVYSHVLVNAETGIYYYKGDMQELCKNNGMLTHSDMTQALGNLDIDFRYFPYLDIATFSGHKIHVPKGIGFIYIREEVQKDIKPFIYGSQERGMRGGTENVPYIAVLGEAVKDTVDNRKAKYEKCQKLKFIAIGELYNQFNSANDNYSNCYYYDYIIDSPAIPSTFHFCLKDVSSEIIQDMLSEEDIFIGTGSACVSGSFEPSETLRTLKVPKEFIQGPIRLSYTQDNTEEEIKHTIKRIFEIYKNIKSGVL